MSGVRVGHSCCRVCLALLLTAPYPTNSPPGLFARAILSSGPCIVPSQVADNLPASSCGTSTSYFPLTNAIKHLLQGWGPATEAYGNTLGASLMKRLNASSIADLRALPPQLLQWDNTTLGSDNFAG